MMNVCLISLQGVLSSIQKNVISLSFTGKIVYKICNLEYVET